MAISGNNKYKAALTVTCILIIFAAFLVYLSPQVKAAKKLTIEVNQALGVQKDNHKYFVAGKNTAIRVYLDAAQEIDSTNTWLSVSRNGQHVFNVPPKTASDEVSSIEFLCRTRAACENWMAGTYTFMPHINGQDYEVSDSYEFLAGTKIRLLAVAVKANYGSQGIKSVEGEKWKKAGNFMQNVYPLAEGDLVWDIRETVLDASAAKFNLEKSAGDGTDNLSIALNNLIPTKCKTSPQGKGCYDFVIGFINEPLTQDNGNSLAGYTTSGLKSVVAVAQDDDTPATVAHEIAHQYGIGDTYDDEKLSSIRCSVNPAPDKFKGWDWDNNFKTVTSCTAGRLATTLKGMDGKKVISGARVSAEDKPYELKGRGVLQEMADFMSEGGAWQSQLWITKDNFDWLFRRLVKQEAGLKSVPAYSVAADPANRFVSFSGTITDADVVEINPWKSYEDGAILADTTGSFEVRAVNAIGTILASTTFEVRFFSVHPPRALTKVPFEGVVNFPAGTVKFQVVKDGSVLKELPVSASAPTVSGVTPLASTTIDDIYTIEWTANDVDGGEIYYTVEYNPDVTDPSSAWIILADGLTDESFTEDFSVLPGGSHAKIRVTAYDGVLYGEAESAEFVVPNKQPEILLAEAPWGYAYKSGEDILLIADAYDARDEWLDEDKIRWYSNTAGYLGSGSELIVSNLSEGLHTITVTATNSAGLSASDSLVINVGGENNNRFCFIATAAFGSYLHPYVSSLRNFRDRYLITNRTGKIFVNWYYKTSPPLAQLIARNEYSRALTRLLLLPLVGFSMLSLKIGVLPAFLLFMLPIVALFVGIRRMRVARRSSRV